MIAGHTQTISGTTANGIKRGDRVEIPAYSDAWMRGARFGTVTRIYRYFRAGLGAEASFDRVLVAVRMDHPKVKRLARVAAADCRKVAV